MERAVTDWREIIAMPDVDAVLVATWPYLHAPASIAALEAGKHVLCLGRMAMNLEEARQMQAAADRAKAQGVRSMLVPPAFGIAGDIYLRQLLAEGYVGDIRHVQGLFVNDANANPAAPLNWRQDRELSGENVLLLGAHYEITYRWLGGVTGVTAREETYVPQRPAPDGSGRMAPVTVPDAITVMGELEQGGTLTLIESSVAHFGGPARFEIYGSAGTLVYQIAGDQILGAKTGESALRLMPIPEGMRREWTVEQDFVRMVLEQGPDVEPTFADGVAYMAFTEAARRSAATGERVKVG